MINLILPNTQKGKNILQMHDINKAKTVLQATVWMFSRARKLPAMRKGWTFKSIYQFSILTKHMHS